jgi:hypothetical protein
MAFMVAALPYITAGMAVGQSIAQGNVAKAAAKIQADQLEKQSIADTAAAVQDAKTERKKAEQLKSRVTALSAKSGASGNDIDRVISDIDVQGEYNSLAALYSGSTAAASKKYAAQAARSYGASEKASSYANAASTILSTMDKQYG